MDKKTAIEWLADQLKQQGFLYDLDIEAAKEIEKEQIIDAYEDGKQNGIEGITNVNKYTIGEYYYNQTYGNGK